MIMRVANAFGALWNATAAMAPPLMPAVQSSNVVSWRTTVDLPAEYNPPPDPPADVLRHVDAVPVREDANSIAPAPARVAEQDWMVVWDREKTER